jgi:hypothetical protein
MLVRPRAAKSISLTRLGIVITHLHLHNQAIIAFVCQQNICSSSIQRRRFALGAIAGTTQENCCCV